MRLTRITATPTDPRWVLALFAHDEAARIRAAVASAVAAASGEPIAIVVAANGCRDRTADQVRACADVAPHLTLVEIDRADKAHAWNVLVHAVLPVLGGRRPDVCYFADGDVTIAPASLPALSAALDHLPTAQAAGGMPATGRDREAWRARMVATGTLAGALYALRGTFVERLQARQIRMPVGLVGEDFLISWLVATRLGEGPDRTGEPQCAFQPDATFAFRSLSMFRPSDYRTHARRLWRYTWRALQHRMLVGLLSERGLGAMPADIETLYRVGPVPSRLVWVGPTTPLRLLAVSMIRRRRR